MKILKFIIIFTGFYFLAGIWINFSNPGQEYAQLRGSIKGKVIDENGDAIPRVRVVLITRIIFGSSELNDSLESMA